MIITELLPCIAYYGFSLDAIGARSITSDYLSEELLYSTILKVPYFHVYFKLDHKFYVKLHGIFECLVVSFSDTELVFKYQGNRYSINYPKNSIIYY